MKKVLSVSFAILILLSFLSGCSNSADTESGNGITEEFTYWLAISDISGFYTQYKDNPIMQYVMNNVTFKNKDGEDARIRLTFEVPATGSEVDTYNLMISTDSYLDIMDTTFGMPLVEMYEAGQVLDLTYYVENYMPNYKAFLDAHPELLPYVTWMIDGERKYLHIPAALDESNIFEQFCGVAYRRDWIVKYGAPPAELWTLDAGNNKIYAPNPNANEPFSFHYSLDRDGNAINTTEATGNVDPESWVDNVIFPSGSPDPIYISDWEWMLEIFAGAIADLGIDDGYVMSLYFPGFIGTGDISCAFGGGGPDFYRDRDTGRAAFGGVTEGFKTYLQCMNRWYQNGWIDKEFQDKTDIFYAIDETKIYQGKIAMWLGAASHLGARIRSDVQSFTEDAMVFGAPQAINDLYGPDSVKFVEPYVMFGAVDIVNAGVCVTNKAKDKDLAVLAGFLDFFWSEEGSILRTMGFGKEQMETVQSPLYLQYGLPEGSYFEADSGKLQFHPVMERDDGGIRGALTALRIPGLTRNSLIRYSYAPTYLHSREQWVRYPATGFFGGMFNSQMTAEEYRLREQITAIIGREYMVIEVPKFITGEKNFEGDYENFLNNLEKRGYQRVLDALNATIDRLSNT